MTDMFAREITVRRCANEGSVVYTCDALPGLFLSSKNDHAASEALPKAIRAALMLDHGIDCIVTAKERDAFMADNVRHFTLRANAGVLGRYA